MSMNKELNSRLFMQQEEQKHHVEYKDEYSYYNNVTEGNVAAVIKILSDPSNIKMYESPQYGKLSKDFLQNIRYHFVVSVALITRLCVENGLERELAYTLSDLYIGRMDILHSASQILSLHNEMLLDFTHKMADLPKKQVYSMQIMKAIDFIYHHRNERLTVDMIADTIGINRSYLSTLFMKETGQNISDFIRKEKITAAANMLRYSDYSYSDIAEYFGFASQSHFIQCFRKETGLTPMKYRNHHSYTWVVHTN